MVLVCFISKNKSKLETCLSAYSSQLTENTEIFILSKERFKLNLNLNADRVFFADEKSFLNLITDFEPKIPDASRIFKFGYGGLRNCGLLLAASLGQDLIFFDDDTAPASHCIFQYSSLFDDGEQIICGKYLNCAGGTTTILLELISTLESVKNNRLSYELAEKKLSDLFGGVPSPVKRVISGSGFNGGNAGISANTLSHYCFFPTNYRVEDGCFASFSKYFIGENAFYNPQTDLSMSNIPVVFHNKLRGSPKTLYNNLLSEAKGSVIAQFIDARASGSSSRSPTVNQASEKVFENFLLTFFKEKINSQHLDAVAARFGKEISERLSELISLSPADFSVSSEELSSSVDTFFFSQKNWANITGLASTAFFEQLTDFSV